MNGPSATGHGPFEIEAYRPDLEPWYVFVRNEGFAAFDSPYRDATAAAYPDPPPLRTFFVRDGPLYVGFIDLRPVCGDPEALDVSAVGLLPQYRRRGLGGILLGAAARFGHDAGYRRLQAAVSVLDPRIHAFWTRHRFPLASVRVEVERADGSTALLAPEEVAAVGALRAVRGLHYLYRRELP
jgi:GNAT superfamily N-acetyltransferase